MEIVPDARLRLGGKPGRRAGIDFGYLEILVSARFRLFRKSWPTRDSDRPEKAPSAGGFRLFGESSRCAISIILEIAEDARFRFSETEPMAGGDFAYSETQPVCDFANF